MARAEWSKSKGEETGQELRKDAAPPQGRGGNRGCRHTCPLSSQKVRSQQGCRLLKRAWWVWKAENPGQLPSAESTEFRGSMSWVGEKFQPYFSNL